MAKKRSKRQASENEIQVKDVGPIEALSLEAKPGTITVLHGPNGSGKSQFLNAADALASGHGKITSRDGTVGGYAEGWGARIKVSRSGANRRSGELSTVAVEDRLNIAQLIDPGIKDPVAADARRLRALIHIAGAEPDIERFIEASEGDADAIRKAVHVETREKGDIVEMASAFKRDCEKAAREHESQAAKYRQEAESLEAANDGIDLDAPHDADQLQGQWREADRRATELRDRRQMALNRAERQRQAREKIEAIRAEYDGPSVEHARDALEEASNNRFNQQEVVDRLQERLADAQRELDELSSREREAKGELAAAKSVEQTIASWQEQLDADAEEIPSEQDVADAEQAAQEASNAVEEGVRVREAHRRRAEAELRRQGAQDWSDGAVIYRDAAQVTEQVLSDIVSEMGGPFHVDDEMRLIVEHPRRGQCYFAELSPGEAWTMAIDVAVEAHRRQGGPGFLAIPQEAWEALDPANRRTLANVVAQTDLVVLAAEADMPHCPECGQNGAVIRFGDGYECRTCRVAVTDPISVETVH